MGISRQAIAPYATTGTSTARTSRYWPLQAHQAVQLLQGLLLGCEACHGSGDGHVNASFPVAYPEPDFDRCGQCHNASFNEVTHSNVEGDEIVEGYKSSPHIHSLNEHTLLNTTTVNAKCAKCHTDEGARQYSTMAAGTYPPHGQSFNGLSPVQCRTCHQAHNPSKLLRESVGVGSPQYNTCTGCHELDDGAGGSIETVHHPNQSPYGSSDEIITDTHFGTAGNWPNPSHPYDENLNAITGYAMDFSGEGVCGNCHNVHSADNTINREWSRSSHADTSSGGAWAHFNWTQLPECQRCHTTSGMIAYLTANALSATPYSAPLTTDDNYNPEMLHCNGCHLDSVGSLRKPGPIVSDYADAPAFTFPDVGGSNICVACHAGQSSGLTIRNMSADFSSVEFESSHYLAAGGILFKDSHLGYEFSSENYANIFYFEHDVIGVTETEGIGEEGPCVGCHMTASGSHLFSPIEESTVDAGAVSAVTTHVCAPCHDPHGGMAAGRLSDERINYDAALQALEAALWADSLFYANTHPYIFDSPAVNEVAVIDWYRNGSTNEQDARNNMGAAFNLVLLRHEPGAYVHNSWYTKMIIFDAIDWLDDNNLVGTINLNSIPGVSDTQAAAEFLHTDHSTSAMPGALLRPDPSPPF